MGDDNASRVMRYMGQIDRQRSPCDVSAATNSGDLGRCHDLNREGLGIQMTTWKSVVLIEPLVS